MLNRLIAFSILLAVSACTVKNTEDAKNSITEDELNNHTRILSSDEFEGRAPFSAGEEKTINYLKDEFTNLGLKPGNGDSFFQEIDLVEIISEAPKQMNIKGKNKSITLMHADEYVAQTRHVAETVEVKNAEIVFAGYGIVAQEYNWDDYKNLDVKDKFVIVMVNDPGYHTQDSSLFNGNAMTYYGRWRYKYEEAARQGAAGIFVVHEDGAAGYPWSVVRKGWTGAEFHLKTENKNMDRAEIEGWFNLEKTREIFKLAGYNFDDELKKAQSGNYKGIELGLTSSLKIESELIESKSNNVFALLEGSTRPDEYIFYMGHWDHLGVDSTWQDDMVFNGARDNAVGIAAILEIAEAFTKLETKPERSIVFFATAVEENGLLGSEYYARNPIYPLNKTVAAINIDAPNVFGKTNDITLVGYGQSELDNYVKQAAKLQGRVVHADPTPEKGFYYRSDHFSFALVGVPAIYIKTGEDHVSKPDDYMRNAVDLWTREYYHLPSDEMTADFWDLKGLVDDTKLLFDVGYKLSMNDDFPEWNPSSEFYETRMKSLSAK
jgi:Zn-dependent M28 family amino/carboxypeptidase